MPGWVSVAIGAAVVLVIVVRRVLGEPVNFRDLWGTPLVLTGLGVWKLVGLDLGPADLAWVVGGSVLGLALGFARGRVVAVYPRMGGLWQRYTWRTFAVAASSLLVMAGFAMVATRLGADPSARPVVLAIGVSFLGEALAVSMRALHPAVARPARSNAISPG